MDQLARWWRFNLVGIIGFAVQMAALYLLRRTCGAHYLLASAAALELTLLHNFLWHLRFTWRDRRMASPLLQLARFQLSNGLVSLAGNLLIVRLLVRDLRIPLMAANTVAVLLCAVANFYLADVWAFASAKRNRSETRSEMVGLSILSLNQFAEHVAQAEALSAEVAIILNGLQPNGALRVGAARSLPMAEEGMENAGMARL